jgi:hypothetical protein
MTSEEKPLFEPDPDFAAGWFVDDPMAQGAFRHASLTILEDFRGAADEIARREPDLDDFGPLGFLPAGLRPALTPLLVNKLAAAATVMGWKLSQPGPPNRPACLAEEFVLELIRREAVVALELVEADPASVAATRGVYEVCEDDDVLDIFAMQEPADAALALGNPINIAMGKADMRIAHWFDPFFGEPAAVLHPIYRVSDNPLTVPGDAEMPLMEVQPTGPLGSDRGVSPTEFRVIVRLWDDAFLERQSFNQMPSTWIFHVTAGSADAALREARENFPDGATRDLSMEPDGGERLDREDLCRVSFDVQRVRLPQELTHGSFHIVGDLSESLDADRLGQLAADLSDVFPEAVVMSDGQNAYFAITINAESHEEADAVLEDFSAAFADAAGLPDFPIEGNDNGPGGKRRHELIEAIEDFRRRG